ncbi:MAG: hypothetical protein JKY51_02695 [Opitutaceae bacterium]|nr:hypothetical protein [Opitutaceae bacterium]
MLALSAIPQGLPNASSYAIDAPARPSEGSRGRGIDVDDAKSRFDKSQIANVIASSSGAPKPATDNPAHTAEPSEKVGHAGQKSAEPKDTVQLSDEAQAAVDKLSARDREVHAHEAAHQTAGGQYAGSASYSYQTGPDGKQYAVGGEVSIDASPISGDPAATIAKMRQIRGAALAPAQPSGQDRAVAAAAAAMSAQAQAELAAQKAEELNPSEPEKESGEKVEPGDGSKPADGVSKIGTPEGQLAGESSNTTRGAPRAPDDENSQTRFGGRNIGGDSFVPTQFSRGGGDKDDPAIDHEDRPAGSQNQILGEIHPGSSSSGHAASAGANASGIPDLTAYATNAYRHQATSTFSRSG